MHAAMPGKCMSHYNVQAVCNGVSVPLQISHSSSDAFVVEFDRVSVLQYMVVYQCCGV